VRLIRRKRRSDPPLLLVGMAVGVWRPAFDNWIEMANRHGYAYELVGRELAEPYREHATRSLLMLRFLGELPPNRLVCFVDMMDAFVCEDVEALLERYGECGRSVVIGAHAGLYMGEAGALGEAARGGFESSSVAVDEREALVQTITGSELPSSFSAPVLHFPKNGVGYNAAAERFGLTAVELDERGDFALLWPIDVPPEPVTSPYRPGEPERIPRTAHYVLDAQSDGFGLAHYLAMRSVLEVAGVDEVHLHCEQQPVGEYWERLTTRVTAHQVEIGPMTHLDVLAEHGGMYIAFDSVFVDRLPGRFRRAQFVLERDSDGQLSTAVLMSKPGAPFVEAWRRKQDPSGATALALVAKMPDEVRVEPAGAFPVIQREASGDTVDEDWIRTSDDPYARAARRFLPER
jgi:hypothetical protein